MKHRAIIGILLFVLLLSACSADSPAVTTPPETNPSTAATTEAATLPLDAITVYEEAAAALGEDLTVTLSVDSELTVGNSMFPNASDIRITYLGLGREDLSAYSEETAVFGEYATEFSETYINGTVYTNVYGSGFSAEMTREDFLSRYIPAVLLDASLYESVTLEGNTVRFSDALAPEAWLDQDGLQLQSASGTATVHDGCLFAATYNATYTLGSADVTLTVKQTISPAELTQITAPDASFVSVENVDAVRLPEQFYGYLLYASDLNVTKSEHILTQAAAYLRNTQTNIYTYVDRTPMFQVEQNIYQMDYSYNDSSTTNVCEIFRDGAYTITVDDGTPEANSSVDDAAMWSYCQDFLIEHVLDPEYLISAECTEVSGAYLAEFRCSDEFGNDTCADLCTLIFDDPDTLTKLASSYKNNALEYYLAVDKYTGLPTSLGIYFEGCHTIDGEEYLLIQQIDYSFDVASLDSYELITKESSPDTKPEMQATPLFYHVTGADGQEMWLFGTIHVGDNRTGYLPQEIYDAFTASDALAVECNNDVFSEQLENDDALSAAVSAAYYYSDGSSAESHIADSALYTDAVKLMKATGNYNSNTEYLKPSMWSSSIENFYLRQGYSLTSDKGMESRLEQLAARLDKPIWEVESVLFQIKMMTDYSDALQEELLAESVYSDPQAYWESVNELYALWCQGDEAALIEALTDDTSELTDEEMKLYTEYNTAMLTDRNAGMLDVAKQYLESGGTVFFAVGLAHLLAEDGLVFTLRDAGYTVSLVNYD